MFSQFFIFINAGLTAVSNWFITVWNAIGGAGYIIAAIAALVLLFWIARAAGVRGLSVGSDRVRIERK